MSEASIKSAPSGAMRRLDTSRHSAARVTTDRPPADENHGHQEKPTCTGNARELLKGRLALPVPEVAKLLGISSAAVRLMIARGDLPGRKVGCGTERVTYIIPTGALLLWLDGAPRVA
jgi:hypothetical protein